ncbi:hypothetical protein JOC75_000508 [Metabacillus crassostreae]|uniref:hypothetical protein n=1 Tax=Metabacillus crassostreae TaxID=929098 RepID=UPI0019598DF9|nr:hypothetical protein [Metabacillus crassostreae]MBM7602538.1 hypothetical protein [Metabacillus crassostreae]
MNDKQMEIFARRIINSLSIEKRKLYQFIENLEDELAQQSSTKEQFLTLLKEQSPHHQAAEHFNMTIEETVNFMHSIEDEINNELDKQLARYKMIDYTKRVQEIKGELANRKQYFLVIM